MEQTFAYEVVVVVAVAVVAVVVQVVAGRPKRFRLAQMKSTLSHVTEAFVDEIGWVELLISGYDIGSCCNCCC